MGWSDKGVTLPNGLADFAMLPPAIAEPTRQCNISNGLNSTMFQTTLVCSYL